MSKSYPVGTEFKSPSGAYKRVITSIDPISGAYRVDTGFNIIEIDIHDIEAMLVAGYTVEYPVNYIPVQNEPVYSDCQYGIHVWIDTGTTRTWCKHCDIDGETQNGAYTVRPK